MSVIQKSANLVRPVIHGLETLAPIGDLLLRLWVANVFWKSGLTKIQGWSWDSGLPQSTLFLFQYEYEVPLLSPVFAAYLGTAIELVFPVLLALGLAGRFAAAVLFAFNIMAVISYPGLQTAGQLDHLMWGIMLLVPLLRGPGKLSIDHLFRNKYLAPSSP